MNEPAGIVKMVAKEGRADDLVALLARMAEIAAGDDGCEIYGVHRSRAEPNTFFIYERYRDKDAMKLHQANAELSDVAKGLRELTDATELVTGNVVAGDGIRRP